MAKHEKKQEQVEEVETSEEITEETLEQPDSPIDASAEKIADLKPSYMSVTYGAGGSTAGFTADIAEDLLKKGVTPISHLTCVSSDEQKIEAELKKLQNKGVENILALRGDIPQGMSNDFPLRLIFSKITSICFFSISFILPFISPIAFKTSLL